MAKRRKSLSEDEIRTILSVFESINEKCHYNYEELNTFMGSITIGEMQDLNKKLLKWYDTDLYNKQYEEP